MNGLTLIAFMGMRTCTRSRSSQGSKTPGGAGTDNPGDNGYTCQIIALENQRESNRIPLFGVAAAI